MLKSPNILDTIGLSRCMVNRKGTTSGLTYSPSCSGSGCKKPTLYFCWKEETVNSQVFQKMLNSKIVPVAYTAYREHNFVYSSYRYINCFKDNGLVIFWSLGNRTPCYPDPNSLVSFFYANARWVPYGMPANDHLAEDHYYCLPGRFEIGPAEYYVYRD